MGPEGGLTDLTAEDEQRLIRLVRSLGKMDTAIAMLGALLAGRAGSVQLQEAYVEACLVKDGGHAANLMRARYAEGGSLTSPRSSA